MSGNPTPPFSIRSLARAGTTLEELRTAVMQAPPGSNVVLLRAGAPVRFLPVCPNCGQPAAAALRIERAFLVHVQNSSDTPNEMVPEIDAFDVPFCNSCLQQRSVEQHPAGSWTPLRRILSDAQGFAGLVAIAIACMFFVDGFTNVRIFPFLLGSLPMASALWLLRSTWNKSRHMALPKPTNVDTAVDFTPVLALPFEPAWRAFQFRSPQYADLFRQANVQQLWDPRGSEAQTAAVARERESFRTYLVVGAIVAAILLWSFWREMFSR